MKLIITIETDNAAFVDSYGTEIERILTDLSQTGVLSHEYASRGLKCVQCKVRKRKCAGCIVCHLWDINGNNVGDVRWFKEEL
jgi:hypothetical protein